LHKWAKDQHEYLWGYGALSNSLTKVVKATGARLVVLDPLGMFMAGEENSNDFVQVFMKDLRAKLADECSCAVLAIHHTGKSNARDSTTDQHVGRGASALAGNSRGVMQLQPLAERTVNFKKRTWSAPEWVTDDDLQCGRVLILYQHKFSYVSPWAGPVVIVRSGFDFRAEYMHWMRSEIRAADENRLVDRTLLTDLAQRQLPISRVALLDLRDDIRDSNGRSFGIHKLRASVARLVQAGHLTVEHGPRGRVDITAAATPGVLDEPAF
jgi:hypothetical protein